MLFKGIFAYAYAGRHCWQELQTSSRLKAFLLMLMLRETAEIIMFKGVFVYAYAKRHYKNHAV